ncbi:MAG: electron transfer flavoprotein subunit beta/FixA family protein [Desulfobacterales bacterium]|nr:MAG: electron transfer flavoprotein subunit beta/FixA family protein [Desulfobacterales bacterium]
MQIYVCVKHVPDTAAKITVKAPNQIEEAITFIMNPYDENAIEEAVRIKKRRGDAEVIAVTLGKPAAENTLRSALAMGADRGILILTEDPPDSLVTARALTVAIEQDGTPDIIFTGKESIDNAGFQTMYRLAAALDMTVVSNVAAFALEGKRVVVECQMEGGARGVIELSLPCVIGAGKGLNKPSYPTLPAIMQARRKEVKRIALDSLRIEKPSARADILELKPAVEARRAQQLKGSAEEVVRQLIRILREEARVIE